MADNGQFRFTIDKSKLTLADIGMHEATIEISDEYTITGKTNKVTIEFEIKYKAATVIEEEPAPKVVK